MAFPESLKLEVKRKAAFRCCRCQQIGIDVHHIMPIQHGGSDDVGNAAPLCPTCHSDFGDNPLKRKEITQMRDWWYDTCARRYGGNPQDIETVGKLDSILQGIENQQSKMDDLKSALKKMANKAIDELTPGTATITASRIASMATEAGTTYFRSVDVREGEAVLICRGDIDMYTAGVFNAVLNGAVSRPDAKRVVVDLTDTDYIDSTAIGVLLHGLRYMKEQRHGILELVVASPAVLRVLSTTGLDRIFTIYASREDAGAV